MVVIRLARGGRKKHAIYRIVVAEKHRATTGKFLAIVGTYDPHTKQIKLDKEKIENYIKNGAQASDRVLRLLKAEGINLPDWAKTHDRMKQPKVKEGDKTEGKPEAKTPAADEVAAEATDKAEIKASPIDAPETAATEEAIAKEQAKVTEAEAEAADEASEETK